MGYLLGYKYDSSYHVMIYADFPLFFQIYYEFL